MDAPGSPSGRCARCPASEEFNEVFFDDVELDADATVGPVDGGWGVAMTTLMFERLAIGAGSESFGWGDENFASRSLDDPARRGRRRAAADRRAGGRLRSRSTTRPTAC